MDKKQYIVPTDECLAQMSVAEFKVFLQNNKKHFSSDDLNQLKRFVENDKRSGIKLHLEQILKERDKLKDEINRVSKLYDFQNTIGAKPGAVILGLDEVGRGPLAGPLTVGGVVLKNSPLILGLNDSKKINEKRRKDISQKIFEQSVCAQTFSIPPKYIDNLGMTECLKRAFKDVVEQVESKGIHVDVILLDGNPLSFDSREVNVIKGDTKCASISAASIIAKVTRDSYMSKISTKYPQYNFEQNKGYGTAQHIDAIKKYGLCPVHRKSFCTSFMQMSLF